MPDTPERLGDKDLPFKRCDECGARTDLYVIDGDALCADCLDDA